MHSTGPSKTSNLLVSSQPATVQLHHRAVIHSVDLHDCDHGLDLGHGSNPATAIELLHPNGLDHPANRFQHQLADLYPNFPNSSTTNRLSNLATAIELLHPIGLDHPANRVQHQLADFYPNGPNSSTTHRLSNPANLEHQRAIEN